MRYKKDDFLNLAFLHLAGGNKVIKSVLRNKFCQRFAQFILLNKAMWHKSPGLFFHQSLLNPGDVPVILWGVAALLAE